jgi:inhibitor of KinA
VRIEPLGDAGILVRFGNRIDVETHRHVLRLASRLEERPFPGMVECVPAFTTVAVFYDPLQLSYEQARELVVRAAEDSQETKEQAARVVEIPVCYGGEFGPDIEAVAVHNGLTVEDVVEIHTSGEYRVYMIGFAPGFPYLGGMSKRIATPRLASPRLSIPAGSVGIAGNQTGVYPIETPGGWRLIGRTPIRLFRSREHPPSLLRAGDIVRFRAIGEEEYRALEEEEAAAE